MKRFFALLLGCMLLCPLARAEQASSYVGIWIENDGYGTLTIRADNTACMDYYDGTVTETTWGADRRWLSLRRGHVVQFPHGAAG